jgi:GxxExxY protein
VAAVLPASEIVWIVRNVRFLRLDLLVNNKVVVECKAVKDYNRVFEAQALTYLRLLDLKLALVINFGARRVSNGIRRVVNGLDEEDA